MICVDRLLNIEQNISPRDSTNVPSTPTSNPTDSGQINQTTSQTEKSHEPILVRAGKSKTQE